jgi:hypothetical protein
VVALATRLPSMLLIWFNHVILDIGSFTRWSNHADARLYSSAILISFNWMLVWLL